MSLLKATTSSSSIYWFDNLQDTIPIKVTKSEELFPVMPTSSTVFYADTTLIRAFSSKIFTYTGDVQTFTVPENVSYVSFDVKGAQGGSDYYHGDGLGEKGGRAQAVYPVIPGQILEIYVGEQPLSCDGGWNGGASITCGWATFGGGGASDIRTGGSSLSNRIISAKGGKGPFSWGGAGGGSNFANSSAIGSNLTTGYQSGNGEVTISWSTSRNTFIAVNVKPIVFANISISSDNSNPCRGSMVNFTATATNQGLDPIYQWYINDIPIGINSPIFSYAPENDDIVKCKLTSDSKEECLLENTIWSNNLKINVQNQSTKSTIYCWSGTNFCEGNSIQLYFDNMIPSCNPQILKWLKDGIAISNADQPWLQLTNMTIADSGSYSCVRLNTLGNDTSNVLKIHIYPIPIAGSINVQVQNSTDVLVTYNGELNCEVAYNWNFSGGTILSGTSTGPFLVRYSDGGYRKVSLTVSNNYCSSQLVYSNDFRVELFEDIHTVLQNMDVGTMEWGDFNNDGLLDILATGTGTTRVYKNLGNDTFAINPTAFPGLFYSTGAWCDFDNDNKLDLIIIGNNGNQNVTKLYRNQGDETFIEVPTDFPGVRQGSVCWLDYNNDGLMDLMISGKDDAGLSITKLFKNKDKQNFMEVPTNFVGLKNSSIDCGDFNNDGYTDIIIQGDDGINRHTKIYKNVSGDFIDIGAPITNVNYGTVKWGDFDKDGKLDFVLSGLKSDPNHSGSNCLMYIGSTTLQFYHNDGNDNFSFSTEHDNSRSYGRSSISLGDYDNDGDLDVAISGTPGIGRCQVGIFGDVNEVDEFYMSAPRIYRNDGNHVFTDIQVDIPRCLTNDSYKYFCVYGSFAGYSIKFGDFNNDGRLDILRTGDGGTGFSSAIYKNNISSENIPPTIPSGLDDSINGLSTSLTWNASSDDHTLSQDLFYKIYVHDINNYYQVSKVNLNFTNNLNFSLAGLSPGKYFWSVRSIDGAQLMSEWSEEKSFEVPPLPDPVITTAVSIYLESCFNSETGLMNTLLNDNSLIPKNQPYQGEPWKYMGTETVSNVPAGVVDWILVELRQAASPELATASTILATRAAFLKNDGSIVDLDGTSPVSFNNCLVTNGKNLYLVIHHRNHLSVMSAAGATLGNGVYQYDFTTGLSQAYGAGSGFKQMGSGTNTKFAMVSGDSDMDGSIFVSDYNKWATRFGSVSGYFESDLDMDGNVFVSDYNQWAVNFGMNGFDLKSTRQKPKYSSCVP